MYSTNERRFSLAWMEAYFFSQLKVDLQFQHEAGNLVFPSNALILAQAVRGTLIDTFN